MNVFYFKDPLNLLDLSFVVMWLVEAIATITDSETQVFRVLRAVRVLRLLRVFRLFSRFDALYVMTTSLKGSFESLIWATLVLFLAMTFFALGLWGILGIYYFPDASQPVDA